MSWREHGNFHQKLSAPGARGSFVEWRREAFWRDFSEASASCGIVLAKMKKAAAMAVFSAALKDPAKVFIAEASAKTHSGSGSFLKPFRPGGSYEEFSCVSA